MADPAPESDASITRRNIFQRFGDWGEHFANYRYILTHPDWPRTEREQRMDAVDTHGESYRQLTRNLHVPATGLETHFRITSPRSAEQVAGDVYTDSILVNVLNQIKSPKEILRKFGDRVAFNDDLSVIAIRDLHSGEVRAYRRITMEKDVTTKDHPNPTSTGFSAAAFAEIRVDPKYTSPERFVQDNGSALANLNFKPQVRMVFQGYQFNFDGSAMAGQLDRGEMPNQFARVLAFNKQVKADMQRLGLPRETEIFFTSHSLGSGNALLSRYFWQHHRDLQGYGTGYVTTIEPVGEVLAVRQAATLIAACKTADGKCTSVEAEMRSLSANVDVVKISPESYIQKFQVHDDPRNNRALGERSFNIPHETRIFSKKLLGTEVALDTPGFLKPFTAFRYHGNAAIAAQLQRDPHLVRDDSPLLTPRAAAPETAQPKPKGALDGLIQNSAYLYLAGLQSFGDLYRDGRRDHDEKLLSRTIRDIAEAEHLTPRQAAGIIQAAQLPKQPVPENQPVTRTSGR